MFCAAAPFEAIYEEPFPLNRLPEDLVHKVIEKIEYYTYARLLRTSKSVQRSCQQVRSPIPNVVDDITINEHRVKVTGVLMEYEGKPVRRKGWKTATERPSSLRSNQINVKTRLTPERCERLFNMFNKNRTQTHILAIHEHLNCEPNDLDKLLKVLDVQFLSSVVYFKSEYFDLNTVKSLSSISMHSCRMTDRQFLSLKGDNLFLCCDTISDRAINTFFREWKSGLREISNVEIVLDVRQGQISIDTILEGLDANPVWTPSHHSSSIIGSIPLDDLPEMWAGDPRHIYSVFRSSNIYDVRLIVITSDNIEMYIVYDENCYLNMFLDEDLFYRVMGICKYCWVRYCDHHPRYSLGRLSKRIPRTWNFFLNSLFCARVAICCFYIDKRIDLYVTYPRFKCSNGRQR